MFYGFTSVAGFRNNLHVRLTVDHRYHPFSPLANTLLQLRTCQNVLGHVDTLVAYASHLRPQPALRLDIGWSFHREEVNPLRPGLT
jgi:hypothetical protein